MRVIISFAMLLTLANAIGCRSNSQYPNCNSTDIEFMDKCLLGNTIEEGISKMNLDTSNFVPILLFAREVHGIYIRLGDSCNITVIVDKPFAMTDEQMKVFQEKDRLHLNSSWKGMYKYILHLKIVAICWRKNKAQKVRIVGDMTYHSCLDY
jgi:hypothetical protein